MTKWCNYSPLIFSSGLFTPLPRFLSLLQHLPACQARTVACVCCVISTTTRGTRLLHPWIGHWPIEEPRFTGGSRFLCWLSTTDRMQNNKKVSAFSFWQIWVSEGCLRSTCEALKNGLQQSPGIPAEPNLREGGYCGGEGRQVGGKVGSQRVCVWVYVCVALQNKPINIPGSLGSCSSKLKWSPQSMKTIQTPNWMLFAWLYLQSNYLFRLQFHPPFSQWTTSPSFSVTTVTQGVKAITATHAKPFNWSFLYILHASTYPLLLQTVSADLAAQLRVEKMPSEVPSVLQPGRECDPWLSCAATRC